MANKGSKKVKVVAKRPRRRSPGAANGALLGHVRMLVDPCNAPLTDSVYGGASSVYRARFRGITAPNVSSDLGTVRYATLLAYHPVMGAYYAQGSSGSTATLVPRDSAAPGWDYIVDNPARAIGACVGVTWTGTELNRQGFVHYGVVNGGFVHRLLAAASGGGGDLTQTFDTIRGKLTGFCRTPNDKCEINFVPTEADAELTQKPALAQGLVNDLEVLFSRYNFVVVMTISDVAFETAPAFQYTNTAIIEYTPEIASQMIIDAAHTSPTPKVSVTSIVRMLQEKDTAWYVDAFKKAAKVAGRLGGAYMRGGALGLVSEVAGMTLGPRKNVMAG